MLPPMPPAIITDFLPDGTVGAPYSELLTADGSMPITWNVENGSLPAGLTLIGDTISGTPTAAGTFLFTVKAENSEGSDTEELSITITTSGDVTQRKEPRYISRTLTDGAPNGMEIMVSGERIRTDTRLHVARIASNAEGYGAYSEAIGEASEEGRLLLSCNIWLTGGFRGRVTVSFHVGEAYNGGVITILHYNRNRLETYTAVVEDGWASIVVDALSPFAVIHTGIVMPNKIVLDPPKTGGAQAAGGALLTLAACAAAVAFGRRRKGV